MIKDRLFENMRNMENTEGQEYDDMVMENETMEWICESEGKKEQFDKWYERCAIEIQAEEEVEAD